MLTIMMMNIVAAMIVFVNENDVSNEGCCDEGSGDFVNVFPGMADESFDADRLDTGVLGTMMDDITFCGCAGLNES
jgi:hypothetical protein